MEKNLSLRGKEKRAESHAAKAPIGETASWKPDTYL